MAMKKIEELKWGSSGLIPAVVQDAATGEVLTVAYVSRESLAKTREFGETVFFSRSRQCLWHKGESSGNTQKVVSIATDCDQDALVIKVQPKGPACHTGARSCFYEEVEGFSI
jgi:phosphoribosyl-AMP cyclohydrolase